MALDRVEKRLIGGVFILIGLVAVFAFVVMPAMWPAYGTNDPDTPHCVTWQEFVDVYPGANPSEGTHRDSVQDHFGPEPSVALTAPPPFDGPNSWAEGYDVWWEWRSCDNDHEYRGWYNRYDHGANVHYHLGKKCSFDGEGGTPDQCWT